MPGPLRDGTVGKGEVREVAVSRDRYHPVRSPSTVMCRGTGLLIMPRYPKDCSDDRPRPGHRRVGAGPRGKWWPAVRRRDARRDHRRLYRQAGAPSENRMRAVRPSDNQAPSPERAYASSLAPKPRAPPPGSVHHAHGPDRRRTWPFNQPTGPGACNGNGKEERIVSAPYAGRIAGAENQGCEDLLATQPGRCSRTWAAFTPCTRPATHRPPRPS